MKVEREVEFFDRFEEDHGDYDVLGPMAYRRLLEIFGELTRPASRWHVIDLGCGSGAFTRRLAGRFGFPTTGMDISPRLVARAAEESSREHYVVGNIMATALPNNGLDCVIYSGVLHHFDDPAMRQGALREGLRILRPGGRMFAYDPSWHSPSMWLYRDPASPLHSTKGKTTNEVLLKRDDLRSELVDAGFTEVTIRGVGGITYTYVESRLAQLILPLYNAYEFLLRQSPLEDRWGTFLVSFGVKPDAAG